MTNGPWKMRYAPHIGFPDRYSPYFRETVGTLHPVAHIEHIAALGFAGIADKDLLLRPSAEQSAIGEALSRTGLEMGAFVDKSEPPYLPWASREPDDVALLRVALERCFEAARRVGGGTACLTPASDPRRSAEAQFSAFGENLRWAAKLAQDAGGEIAIEPISRARVPGALVRTVADADTVLAGTAGVGLILDTLHASLESVALSAELESALPRLGLVQIADMERKEPGSGSIDFLSFLHRLREAGYTGLIELEHVHSRQGREGEEASLAALRRIDAAI